MMEDDATSTTTMTSVTDELSVDDLEVTENDLEMSSQITTSDANEEGNTTMVNTPLLQMHGKHVDSNNAASDVSMGEDSGKGNSKTTTEERNSNSQPRKDQLPKLSGPGHSDAGDPPEKGIQFPNLLSMPDNWYEHHCFDRYWRHYQFVSMWCQKHMQVYRTVWQQYKKMADQLEAARRAQKPHSHSQSDGHVFKKPTSSRTIRNRKARRRRKAAKKRMRMALKNAEMAGSGSSFSQSSDEGQKAEADKGGETTESAVEGTEEEEEEMQIEISEEMLDFFAHTHKHRQERGIFLLLFRIRISLVILSESEACLPGQSPLFPPGLGKQPHRFSLISASCSRVCHWRSLWVGQC